MKGWKLFALLLPALLLCACGQKEPARENSPPETTVPVEERVPLWSDLRWDGRLELDYAEGYTVDFSPEGYAGSPLTRRPTCWCPSWASPRRRSLRT